MIDVRQRTRAICLLASVALGAVPYLHAEEMLPVIDTHIHYWNWPRDDGARFPDPEDERLAWLQGDRTLKEYAADSPGAFRRIGGIILVESSVNIPQGGDFVDANEYMLRVADREELIIGVVGKLSFRDPDFEPRLRELAGHAEFVGLRVPGSELELVDGRLREETLEALGLMASLGLSMDVLSGITMPQIAAVAEQLPAGLRMVINHFGPIRGDGLAVSPDYAAAIESMADLPDVFMKVSDIQRRSAGTAGASWPTPFAGSADLEPYRARLDLLYQAWGPRRLMWGSNWPVSEVAGPYGQQLRILDAYLKDKDDEAAEWVYRRTALRAYGLK